MVGEDQAVVEDQVVEEDQVERGKEPGKVVVVIAAESVTGISEVQIENQNLAVAAIDSFYVCPLAAW